ncbi:MAG: thymidine phosphorylase [Clostridiales bacterium]|nr:thymidine phosphorylase [Clostridiales bacterium]
MRMYDIILKKRNGAELSDEEIAFFVKGYTNGDIPDYQASAFCMAVYFKGMNDRETATLTNEMAHSGETLDLSVFGSLSADKHSTGGVGDKTSLIVTPIVAALGCKVAKMSGRGLGHTGGTVDKLEAIPGYKVSLSPEDFIEQVKKTGLSVIGQTGNMTPADKKLYALRDVTATVESIPLITSSIMSKKIAAGAKNIVLDVKVGSGAFMKTLDDASVLAEKMVEIGKRCNRNMAAVLTDMNTPLGHTVGNALEVKEAVAVLKGERIDDLRQVCITLASNLLSLTMEIPIEDAALKVNDAIDSGLAFEKMKEWVSAQGGDVSYIENILSYENPDKEYRLLSPESGYIADMDVERIGNVSVILGAGRSKKDDGIDYDAGIIIYKKTGDFVDKGEALCSFYSKNVTAFTQACEEYLESIKISQVKPEDKKLIYKVIR